jgi:two-component system, chemotaxis family, CheB/CheR fusion protein
MATKKPKPDPKKKKAKTSPKDTAIANKAASDFRIVGIGASAGGLEALEQFFGNMPIDNGMAFVVIQHLDPKHKGIMPELLQRITSMKVIQATDRVKIVPNCVYVIPPNKSMSILNGALHLFDIVENQGIRLPIDIFFRSLAEDTKEKSIGIILSGMGSDGSLGLKAIKENNGIVLVQDPDSAKFNGMPQSAIESVIVDIIASADELPSKLIECLKFIPSSSKTSVNDKQNISSIEKVIILLRQQTGHDFSLYKKNTLLRRIERRKGVHQIDNIRHYILFLQENPEEIEILFRELLIGVTSFFRDKEVWEMLKEKIMPDIIKESPNGSILRAWVPACSTGEEVFSLAIVFKEALETTTSRKNLTLQIFATDLDNNAIEIARKGYFSKNIISDVSNERIKKYFTEEENGYRVITSIREMIVFAPQNVIKDPPFTKLDILSCRNMLIYMEPELQKKIITLFHYSLNSQGIMILGTAETLGVETEGFKELSPKYKIYKNSSTLLSGKLIDFPTSFYSSKTDDSSKKIPQKDVGNIQTLADQLILQGYSPASVIVNNKGDIIYITGRTGKYLEPPAGKANWNIFAMARDGLRQVLPGAFRKTIANCDAHKVSSIKVGINGGTQYVDIIVQRIENPKPLRGLILIVFNDIKDYQPVKDNITDEGKVKSTGRLRELEIELQRSYDELQSTNEEMQTSQEELKSTNEELQSTNEELQSTNEELTTSKEEMQSLNEELQTVNIELQSKINDYKRANDDMKNLLNSTELATLFLDKDLNIRRFTDQVTHIFKLRSSDIGRPFTDIVSYLKYPDISKHASSVLKTLISNETSIETEDGSWYDVRIMPYRTIDDRIDRLVVTFTDITVAKKLEIELKEVNKKLRSNSNEE